MKKFLLGIAMLLTASVSFGQGTHFFSITPDNAEMAFDVNNPDFVKTVKDQSKDKSLIREFTVVLNTDSVEKIYAGLVFITIPKGLQVLSYSDRTEKWHVLAGSLASGELTEVVESSAYDKEHNILKFGWGHGTTEYGMPFESPEPLFKFKCAVTDEILTGEQKFVFSDNPYPSGTPGVDETMSVATLYNVFNPPVTETPITLGVKLEVKDSKFATLSWPLAIDFEGTGLKASVVTDLENGFANRQEVTQVPAETPVILEAAAGTYKINTIDTEVAEPAANILEGNLREVFTATDKTFALADKAEGVGFYRCKEEGVEIPKYKAYIVSDDSAAESYLFEETTGISNVETTAADGETYTISGVRVNKPTQKGMYIVNGKKVVVK